MKPTTAARITLGAAVALAALAIWAVRPPAVVPADAPAQEFSAERTGKHLEVIAREMHPIGTVANETVRGYIAGQLRTLGVEPELQEAVVAVEGWGPGLVAASVTNVLARLPGSRGGGKALLLMAHYDSARSSYGAGDDGSGVVALLETLRAVQAGPPLANDVIFLFTDGEEAGLLGAEAFVDQHPWAKEVGLVLNFEARGTHGPAIMFETSPGNGRLIAELRRAVRNPVATSYSYEIYRRMPNDTDFTPFRRAGYPGLNTAFIHDESAYHLPEDQLSRLDLASVQHLGAYALGLTRAFGSADLDGSWEAPNATYFNLLGPLLVTYPGGLGLPLAVLALVGALAFLAYGLRRRRLSLGGFAGALLLLVLCAAALAALMIPLSILVFRGFYNFRLWAGLTSVSAGSLALALIAAGLTVAVFRLLGRKLRGESFSAAGLALWAALGLFLAFQAAGASYLFTLPALLALPAAFAWLRGGAEGRAVPATLLAWLLLAAAAAALLWAPTLSLLGVALFAAASVPLAFMLFLLLAGLLAPVLTLGRPLHRGWLLPVALVALGLGLGLAVRQSSVYSEQNRQRTSLLYTLDAESGEARWLSYDEDASPWAAGYLGEGAERAEVPAFLSGPSQALSAPAPAADLPAPGVSAWRPQPEGPVEVGVTFPERAERAILHLSPASRLESLALNGHPVEELPEPDGKDRLTIHYHAPPPDGIRLTLGVAGAEPLTVEAVSQRFHLDGIPGVTVEPRPVDAMATFGWNTDSVFVRTAAEIQPEALPAEPPAAQGEAGTEDEAGASAPGGIGAAP